MFQKEFDSSYVGFTVDGAKWLVENTDIKLVGRHKLFFYISATFTHDIYSDICDHVYFCICKLLHFIRFFFLDTNSVGASYM